MEQTSFELTPQQKGMLASLLDETGQPVPTLMTAIAAALEELQAREPVGPTTSPTTPPQSAAPKPIWEQFAEAFDDVPEEELARLPTDLAAQVDHYVYGLPKR